MKLYDWFIVILIGALFGGAYFAEPDAAQRAANRDASPLIDLTDTGSLGLALGVTLAVFFLYRWLFPDPSLAARKHAASAILLGLTALGIQLWFGHVLLRGTLEPADLANLMQLNRMVIQFSQVLLAMSAIAFAVLSLFALTRRSGG